MNPKALLQYVGDPYQKTDENGNALGCMAPVYVLYPEIPRYEWPNEGKDFFKAVFCLLKKHGKEVRIEDIEPGDVVAIRAFFNLLHIGVYIGDDTIVHCSPDTGMESFRMSMVRRSIKGVFRWRT